MSTPCYSINSMAWRAEDLKAPAANTDVWTPAITGNVVIVGANPVARQRHQIIFNGISFALNQTGYSKRATGLYACMSCYYNLVQANSPVVVAALAGFGRFESANAASPSYCTDGVHKGGSVSCSS